MGGTPFQQAMRRRARQPGLVGPYVPTGLCVAATAVGFGDGHWHPVALKGPARLLKPAQAEGYVRVAKGEQAHRHFYRAVRGPIPGELPIDHLCRVTGCCAPAHLEAVPGSTNILRGASPSAQNARKTHCAKGHELSDENVRVSVRSDGPPGRLRRRCAACSLTRAKAYQARLREMRRRTGESRRQQQRRLAQEREHA